MNYWELNSERRIVALCRIDGLAEPGDIGGCIPEGTTLPDTNEMFWVACSAYLGEGVHLGADVVVGPYTRIYDDVRLARGVRIGNNTVIGKGSIVDCNTQIKGHCDIGKNCFIGECCYIDPGAAIGNDCSLGVGTELSHCVSLGNNVSTSNCVRLAQNAQIVSDVELNPRSFVQWVGFGLNNRTIAMYIRYGQVAVSVGCQVGIPFDYFVERVVTSTEIYQAAMPMFKAAKEYLECSIK